MPVSPDYRDYVLEQLSSLGPVTGKPMFGGVGIYLDGVFFALIANDTVYLKVDDTTRRAYEAAGMAAFKPYPDRPMTMMSYYEIPVDGLENTDELRTWGHQAVEVASRARATHPTRGRPRESVQSKKKPSKGGSR